MALALFAAAPAQAGLQVDTETSTRLMNEGQTAVGFHVLPQPGFSPVHSAYVITQGTSGRCGAVYEYAWNDLEHSYHPLTLVHQFSSSDPLGCNPVAVDDFQDPLVDTEWFAIVVTDNGSVIEFGQDNMIIRSLNVPHAYATAVTPPAPGKTTRTASTPSGTLYVLAHGNNTPANLLSVSAGSGGALGTPAVVYTFPRGFLPTFVDPDSIAAGPDGALYGVASAGGNTGAQCSKAQNGCGLIFRLRPVVTSTGTQWKLTTLYTFLGGADGNLPQSRLAFDAAGNIYGATQLGGDLSSTDAARCTGPEFHQVYGCGVIFRLRRGATYPWTETVLHTFHDRADGAEPVGPVTLDAKGNIVGTTVAGGYPLGNCASTALGGRASGCGVVFELVAAQKYAEQVLYAFHGKADGAQPAGAVAVDAAGLVSGITWTGGDLATCPVHTGARGWAAGCGVVYTLTPPPP